MSGLPYFPLNHDSAPFSMGVKVLEPAEPLVETTERYADEIRLKRWLLDERPNIYAALPDGTSAAQRETFDYLLPHCSAITHSPTTTNGFYNHLLQETISEGPSPLLTIARHLQEDLVLLNANLPSLPVIAGVVCFPSGWSIAQKLGLSLANVHAPVPEFENQLGEATQRLLHRLKPNRPVWRMNWGIRASAELDQTPDRSEAIQSATSHLIREAASNPSVIGNQCFIRVERQTLSKLPETNSILFTIHTYQTSLAELSCEQRCALGNVIKRCSTELLAYKGISGLAEPLMQYLALAF